MILFLSILMFLVLTPASHAVVPGMWPFLQSLASFLPHILLFVIAGISFIFSFRTWKRVFSWLSRKVRTKVGIGVAVGVILIAISSVVLYLALSKAGKPIDQPAQEQSETDPGPVWAAFRGNVQRSGNLDGGSGPQEAKELWSFREALDRAGFASSPAVVNDRVYVGANNSYLYCFNAANGDVIWKFEANYEVFSSPAVVGDRVYFGEGLHYTEDATFHCVDANTGKEVWSFNTTSHGESSPYVADGKVVFGAGEDGVYCLDAETGSKLWQYPSVYVAGSLAIYDGMVYFGSGYGVNGIYCLALDDGKEIWTVGTEQPAWGAPAVWDDKLYIGAGEGNFVFSADDPGGSLMCLNARTGEILWEFEVDDTILGAVAIDNGKAYFGSRDSSLYCVDALSGKEEWAFATDGAIVSSPAITDKSVYFGSGDGRIYCLDKEDVIERWEFDTSESGFFNLDSRIIGSPAISGGRLFVGSMNFFFYCLGSAP